MQDPRLSIIVTFYDETAFLGMAVRSVLAQGLTGVEILIVNDNPDRFDPAWFAAQGLPAQVRVLHHDRNLGLSAARNTGLAAARGDVVGFLDADDYFMVDGLAAQLALAETGGADITHAPCCISHVGSPEVRPHPRDAILFPAQHQGAGLAGFEPAQFITSSWSSLYRRRFLDRGGLRFDPVQVKFEDRLFVLQTVTAAASIATLGRPVRVWRRRAGSISVTPPDAFIHRLQVQLLEKCMEVMRAHAERPGVAPRFLRRERFNTVSRLIWDMDVVTALAEGRTEGIADLGPRIVELLGDEAFGQAVFDDPVIAQISRVGQRTRRGLIRRVDFFAIHKALREGDFPAAAGLIAERTAAARPPSGGAGMGGRRRSGGAELILHLGMHKTGSTWLQRALQARSGDMAAKGVLFPKTGLNPEGFVPTRPDGFPGHQGLVAALRKGQREPWRDLADEVAASRCTSVILSCENMLFPLEADRDDLLAQLFDRLSGFASVRVVAFARRPDHWTEMFYRELVCNAHRHGARNIDEFMVDYADRLTDLPALFQPFETFAGRPVTLLDHDASARAGQHLPRFLAAAGLAGRVAAAGATVPAAVYPTPDRDTVGAARLICSMISQGDMRQAVMRAFFAAAVSGGPSAGGGPSLLSPAARLGLIDRFAARSQDWAAARGYAPDPALWRAELEAEDWMPPGALSADLAERLHQARLQAERPLPAIAAAVHAPAMMAEVLAGPQPRIAARPGELVLRLRPRPWLRRLLTRLFP